MLFRVLAPWRVLCLHTVFRSGGGSKFCGHPMVIGDDADAPPHETVTVPVPGLVFEPITQLHEIVPFTLAAAGTSPCVVLTVPAGVT